MRVFIITLLVIVVLIAEYQYKEIPALRTYTTLYSQLDPLWKNVKLSKTTSNTFGTKGCLLVAFAMIANAAGHSVNPVTFGKQASSRKMIDASGWTSEFVLPKVVPTILLVGRYTNRSNTKLLRVSRRSKLVGSLAEMATDSLSRNYFVVAKVDGRPRSTKFSSHWVLVEKRLRDDFVIIDPGSGTRVSLRDRYGSSDSQTLDDLLLEVMVFKAKKMTPS